MPNVQDTPVTYTGAGSPAWEQWKLDPTPKNMSNVLKELDPVLVSEVQRYSGPKEILYWKGKKLAVDAIKRYDPVRGASLRTWVTTQLKPLTRYGQHLAPVRVPEAVRRQAAEIYSVTERLHDQLGRMPTDEELSDDIGLSVPKIRTIRQRTNLSVSDSQMVDLEGNPRELVVQRSNPTEFAAEAVYDGLSPQEKLVYDWKTGSHGRDVISNKEIAARLGVSAPYITQLSQRVANRIQEVSGYGV